MKLSIRLPLLIGAVVLITSVSIGFAAIYISSETLERTTIGAVSAKNESNAEILTTRLQGQLNVLSEFANNHIVRTMDWDIVQPILARQASRLGALDLAMASPDGVSRYAIDNQEIDIRDRDYFRQAMAGQQSIETVFSRISGRIVVLFSAPIFESDDPGAAVIGVLVARKDGGSTLSDIVVNLTNSMRTGHSYLVNEEGTLLAHRNAEFIASELNPIKAVERDPSLRSLADTLTTALRERTGISRYTFEGREMVGHYTEVPGFQWLLFTSIETSEFGYELRHMRFVILMIGLAFLVCGLVVAMLIGISIAKPMVGMAETLKDVGKGDLTKRIDVSSKDEIGVLSENFNTTLDGITGLVFNIRQEADMLSGIGHDLADKMNETAAAVNHINNNIQNIQGRVINQSASVSQTHATMEQVVKNIDKLNGHVENQSGNISMASSAIEQMVANTQSVTNTLVKNTENAKALMEASEIGRGSLSEVAANIREIAQESEGLMEINSLIDNIASQTNLLSMNAAIEAAHAGDRGSGFAVVAGEIRKLAESSGEQSKIISQVLKKMKASIDHITASTDNVMDKFEAIDTMVRVVVEQEDHIRTAMEEQGLGGRQILKGVGNVNEITRQVKSGSREMHEEAKEVIQESENLEKATKEISFGMNEMASSAEQINKAVNGVNQMSFRNREGIAHLVREVSRFKVA